MGNADRAISVVTQVLRAYPYWTVTIEYDQEDRVFEALIYDTDERIYRFYEMGSTVEEALIALGHQMTEDDVLLRPVLNAGGLGQPEGET